MKYLLLGAGFSKNWDRYLAEEVQGSLLGLLHGNGKLNKLLNDNTNFEKVLEQVQAECKDNSSEDNKRSLVSLQEAIVSVFGRMNKGFEKKRSMGFSNSLEFSIQKFLCKFDVIFTLNQDLLFELYYDITTAGYPRLSGHFFPGMQRPPCQLGVSVLEEIWHPNSHVDIETEIKRNRSCQPIIKLHGSVNWRDLQGENLLIIGDGKMSMIENQWILSQYYEYFKKSLDNSDVSLMVIGYSFSDDHINVAIKEAWQRSKIKVFAVSLSGDKKLKEKIEGIRCAGKSSRLLKDIFAGDRAGLDDLECFFK